MRTIAVIAALVVSGDQLHSCGAPPREISVDLVFPDGPGTHGVSTLGCSDWVLGFGPDRISGQAGRSPCSVVGWRRDGLLTVRSTPFPLDREVPDRTLGFDLPTGPIAGIGVLLDEQMEIQRVVPGSPAERAGLRAGMVITSVDGWSGGALPLFVRHITGAPDTPVSLGIHDPSGCDKGVALVREEIH